MKNDAQICGCGTCSSHYDRALKIAKQMAVDGECCNSIAAVAGALRFIAGLMPMYGHGIEPFSPAGLIFAVKASSDFNEADDKIETFMASNIDTVKLELVAAGKIMEKARGEPKGD